MVAVGLDGFRKGWVVVRIGDGVSDIHFPDDISALTNLPFDHAAIDIPVGLPPSGHRACDLIARQKLRPHHSRIFTGARRGLWDFPDAAAANVALHARGEPGISLQLWHLGPKITEVDRFIRVNRAPDIRETHPELVFLRLNGDTPLPSKTEMEGIALRKALLACNGFDEAVLDIWLTKTRIGKGAKIDDVLDACAAAIAARDFDRGFCLPAGDTPRDSEGLPMQIWY